MHQILRIIFLSSILILTNLNKIIFFVKNTRNLYQEKENKSHGHNTQAELLGFHLHLLNNCVQTILYDLVIAISMYVPNSTNY